MRTNTKKCMNFSALLMRTFDREISIRYTYNVFVHFNENYKSRVFVHFDLPFFSNTFPVRRSRNNPLRYLTICLMAKSFDFLRSLLCYEIDADIEKSERETYNECPNETMLWLCGMTDRARSIDNRSGSATASMKFAFVNSPVLSVSNSWNLRCRGKDGERGR